MVHISALTHPGKQQSINQDCMVIQEHFYDEAGLMEKDFSFPLLVMVLDGVGGHGDGRLASHTVAKSIQALFLKHQHQIQESDVFSWIEIAHNNLMQQDPDQRSLTTLVGMVMLENQTIVFNVGDSKLFAMKGQKIKKLSMDDTLYQTYLKQGNLAFGEDHLLKNSHTITHAIGASYFDPLRVHVETLDTSFDYYLLCTDGVSDYIDAYTLYELFLKNQSVTPILTAIIDQVMAGKAADNLTCMVIQPIRRMV